MRRHGRTKVRAGTYSVDCAGCLWQAIFTTQEEAQAAWRSHRCAGSPAVQRPITMARTISDLSAGSDSLVRQMSKARMIGTGTERLRMAFEVVQSVDGLDTPINAVDLMKRFHVLGAVDLMKRFHVLGHMDLTTEWDPECPFCDDEEPRVERLCADLLRMRERLQ